MSFNEYDSMITSGNRPQANEYDAMLSDVDDETKQNLKQSMRYAQDADPDRTAKVTRLANEVGVAPDIADRNFDELSKKPPLEENEYDDMLRVNPKTTAWISADPKNAALVKDEIKEVSKLEQNLNDHSFMESLSSSLKNGLATMYSNVSKVPALAYDVFAAPQNFIANEFDLPGLKTQAPEWLMNNPAAKYYDEVSKNTRVPELETSISESIGKGEYGKAGKALAAQFVANAPNQAALLLGGLMGYGIPAAISAGATTAAGELSQGRVSGADPLANTVNAVTSGTIEAAFERLGTFGILKKWEGKIASKYGKEASKQVFRDFAQTMIAAGAGEANEEFMTSVAQDFSSYVTGVNPNALEGIGQRALDAGIIGGASGGAMTGPTAVMSGYARVQSSRKAEANKNFYLSMGKTAEATKLRQRLPEAQRELVEKIVQGTPVENIYVQPEAIDQYFQGAALKEVHTLGLIKEYEEAKATGTPVKIPLALWADKMVGTPAYDGLANDIKFSPDGMSVNEEKASKEESKKTEQEAYQTEKSKLDESAALVKEDVKSKLIASGKFDEPTSEKYAALWEGMTKSFGDKLKLDPVSFFMNRRLTIESPENINPTTNLPEYDPLDDVINRLRAGDTIKESDAYGPSLTEFVRKSGGIDPNADAMGGDVLSMELDSTRKPFEKSLTKEGGMSVATAAARAFESGYIQSDDPVEFLNALDDESRGTLKYSEQNKDQSKAEELGVLRDIESRIKRANIDLSAIVNNADVKAALTRALTDSYDDNIFLQSLNKSALIENEQGLNPAIKESNWIGSIQTTDAPPELAKRVSKPSESAALKKEAEKFLLQFQTSTTGKTISNASLGSEIDIPKNGIKEITRAISTPQQSVAALMLPELLSKAQHVWSDSDRKGKTGLDKFHYLYAPMRVNGVDYIVKFSVKKTAEKGANPKIYHLSAYEVERPEGVAEASTSKKKQFSPPHDRPLTFSLADLKTHINSRREGSVTGRPDKFYQSKANINDLGFFSKLEQTILDKMGGSASPKEIMAWLKEVKPEEIKWSGIEEFLKGKTKVSKEDLLDFVRANQLEIKEVTKGNKYSNEQAKRQERLVKAEAAVIEQARKQGIHDPSDYAMDAANNALSEGQMNNMSDEMRPLVDELSAAYEARQSGDYEEAASVKTKFDNYTLPGGENYREVLLTLPVSESDKFDPKKMEIKRERHSTTQASYSVVYDGQEFGPFADQITNDNGQWEGLSDDIITKTFKHRFERGAYSMQSKVDRSYRSSHWDEANVLAHTRLNDRTDSDGKRVLFIEEIQSDWHQEGRKRGYVDGKLPDGYITEQVENTGKKGYSWRVTDAEEKRVTYGLGRTEAEAISDFQKVNNRMVPDAPFKKTWHEFVFKRIVRMAAEQGYDSVAWTTGDQQAERYDLSKQISSVSYKPETKELTAFGLDGESAVIDVKAEPNEIENYIGKEAAKNLLDSKPIKTVRGKPLHSISGDGLKVGGEGMKGFYDKILVDAANKLVKKFGGKVGKAEIPGSSKIDYKANKISDEVRDALEAVDNLGFGSPGQAAKAVIDNSDWATRFDVANEPGTALIGRWRDRVIESTASKVHSIDITPKLKEAALNEGFSLFQGKTKDAPRGAIRFLSDGQSIISLFKDADLTTFLHETGHAFLEILADAAELADSPQAIKDDYAKVLEWLGVKSRAEIKREHHEQFARGFEAYLGEGKAPSSALRQVFAKFRTWIIAVYGSLKKLNVELSPEIRGVFDRLIATDAEIEAAQNEITLGGKFKEALLGFMKPDMALRYSGAIEDAKLHSQEVLGSKVLKEAQRERTAWWKEERANLITEYSKDFDKRPEQIALAHLQNGKNPDGSPLPEGVTPIKISKKSIIDKFGESRLKTLPKHPYVYSKDGGIDVDTAAAMFGFNSGGELLHALENAPKREAVLEAQADARMKEIHGDMRIDGTMVEEAMNAVHNDMRSEALAMEIKYLASEEFATLKGLAKRISKPIPTVDQVRAQAEEIIAGKQVKDIIPYVYQRAEIKAAKQAVDLFWKGDIEGAFNAKSKELLNHELYKSASYAQEKVDKIYEYAKKFRKKSKREQLGKADYLEQIDAILHRYQFAQVSNKELEAREKTLAEWIQEKQENGESNLEEINISPELLKEDFQKNYRLASFEELEGVYDTLRQMEKMAILADKVLTQETKVRREQMKEELVSSIVANIGKRPKDPYSKSGENKKDVFNSKLRSFDSSLIKIEALLKWFDDFNPAGAWQRYVFNPASDAQSAELDASAKITAAIHNHMQNIPKSVQKTLNDLISIPGIDRRLTRMDAIVATLNSGTESSYSKLQRGNGWTVEQIQAMTNELTLEETQFVQGIWDTLESLWPEISSLQKELTGLEPEKLESKPVQTKHGELKGGYYPMMYDPNATSQGEVQVSSSVGKLTEKGYTRATTPKGHTKSRVERFSAPVDMNLHRLVNHISGVIKDLTHRKWLIDMNWILSNKDIRAAINEHMGPEYLNRLKEWTKEVVNDRNNADLSSLNWADHLISKMRSNFSIAAMGFKATVMLSQVAGVGPSIETIGGKEKDGKRWLAYGLQRFLRSPRQTYKMIVDKSGEMRHRLQTKDVDLRDKFRALEGKDTLLSEIQRFSMNGIGIMDMMVSIPTWLGAYEKALRQGHPEDIAIHAGDSAVRLSQGAGGAKDLAAVVASKDKFMRLTTMLYTPFSALYSQLRTVGYEHRGMKDSVKTITSLTWLIIIPSVLSELLSGRGPEGDDDEFDPVAWSKWFASNTIGYSFASIPLVRDLTRGLEALGGHGYTPTPLMTTAKNVAEAANVSIDFAGKISDSDAEISEEDLLELAKANYKAAQYWFGLPTRQVEITGGYIADYLDGTEDPDSFTEFMSGLLYVRPKK